ncbi:BnaA06g10740D [Brassica napus]|uniref:BnaA06g10740D protein n=1 Tax=Brassica napus TaxID=3708 RepID=A0A078HC86_BRANA|nr:BnaA06g10740D [Brassica napus]
MATKSDKAIGIDLGTTVSSGGDSPIRLFRAICGTGRSRLSPVLGTSR